MDNLFCVLGGGNHIGASCYYLQVDGHSFLLDCGIRSYGPARLPALSLLTEKYLDGLWQLDQVIISHAHMDHIGGLPYLDEGRELSIRCNPVTQTLIELQLRNFDSMISLFPSDRQRRAYEAKKERVLNMLQPQGFGKTYTADGYAVTLFPAGHMPGAAMTYIETSGHHILYTGDFSGQRELLCGSYHLPADLPVDLLIIEGTHAYTKDSPQQGYWNIEKRVVQQLQMGHTVTLETTNVTKGIELSRYLAASLDKISCRCTGIYLASHMAPIAAAFEAAGYQIYTKRIRPLLEPDDIGMQAVVIKKGHHGRSYGTVFDGDAFTLHADCQTLIQFINQVQAETTLIVHAQPSEDSPLMDNLDIGARVCIQTMDEMTYLFS